MADITIYQWLLIFSVPTLILTGIVYLWNQINGVRRGVQALLRAQLISEWEYHSSRGFAPIYARENFENIYIQYHRLGANGVMDDIRKKFLALPEQEEMKS